MSYWVVTYKILIHKINPKNKASIHYLVDKNCRLFPDLFTRWICWLKLTLKDKSVASLIIEAADPEVSNCMIDERIVIGASIDSCTFYNLDCCLKQCFKCLKYRNKAVKYSKKIIWNKCSGQHRASKCSDLASKCEIYQSPHESFDKNCPESQKN